MPFDLAFQLDDLYRAAFCIVFAGFHGNEFDWNTGQFKKKD